MTLTLDRTLTTAQHDAAMDFFATASSAAFHAAARLHNAGLTKADALAVIGHSLTELAQMVGDPDRFRAELLKETAR